MEITKEKDSTTSSSPADSISIAYQEPIVDKNEGTWPTDRRAYVALFGGFLLMFNSWYVTPSPHHHNHKAHRSMIGAWSTPLEPSNHTT